MVQLVMFPRELMSFFVGEETCFLFFLFLLLAWFCGPTEKSLLRVPWSLLFLCLEEGQSLVVLCDYNYCMLSLVNRCYLGRLRTCDVSVLICRLDCPCVIKLDVYSRFSNIIYKIFTFV